MSHLVLCGITIVKTTLTKSDSHLLLSLIIIYIKYLDVLMESPNQNK